MNADINYTPYKTTETLIEETFGEDAEVMKRIAICESGMRQLDSNGQPITSHTKDSGLFQINQATWDDTARAMGLDYIWSEEDNIKMAKHILDVQGKNAWVCYRKI